MGTPIQPRRLRLHMLHMQERPFHVVEVARGHGIGLDHFVTSSQSCARCGPMRRKYCWKRERVLKEFDNSRSIYIDSRGALPCLRFCYTPSCTVQNFLRLSRLTIITCLFPWTFLCKYRAIDHKCLNVLHEIYFDSLKCSRELGCLDLIRCVDKENYVDSVVLKTICKKTIICPEVFQY